MSGHEDDPWQRAQTRWDYPTGPGNVSRYELAAVLAPIERKLDVLHDRIEEIEDRLVDERAKRALVDLVTTGVGRLTLLALTLLLTFATTHFYDWP